MADSILDKIISSKHNEQMREFDPPEAVAALLKQLSSKEEDILRRRYGLNGQEKQTLEDIGQLYKLTRERIRQIESTAIKRMKKFKNFEELVGPIETTLRSVLDQNGGAVSKERFLELVFEFSPDTEQNRQAIAFIITKLLTDAVLPIASTSQLHAGWRSPSTLVAHAQTVIERLIEIIRAHGQPMNESELMKSYRQRHPVSDGTELTDQAIAGHLTLSQKISRNPFGDYGLSEWGSIVPRRMNDKIFLVLKKEGKPMHFTQIADRINEIGFDQRKAYPPTVHNELILNDRYVLVGRGIYALQEWGYKPGVVSDVIVEVLTKHGQPMTRDEIVDAVLAQRIVKKNTIHLALTDQNHFRRLPDGRFEVNAAASVPQPGSETPAA